MLPYIYFLKVIICSAILLVYYYAVLRNKVYHQYNRFYLLITVALSWSIPLIPFEILIEPKHVAKPVYEAIEFFNIEETVVGNFQEAIIQPKLVITKDDVLRYSFLVVAFALLLKLLYAFYIIIKLKLKHTKQTINNYKLYITQEPSTPFSFFKNIFWNTNIDIQSTVGKQILEHEFVHIKERHSWDKILMQLNLIAGWFNPMFWLVNKELSMIHEFIADKKSVPNANTEIFAQMLLNTVFAGNHSNITNPFFLSPIKRRLTMLTKKSLPKFSYVQRLLALPLLVFVVCLCSLKAQGYSVKKVLTNVVNNVANKELIKTETDAENNADINTNTTHILTHKYKVVIDAGHGGTDLGATAPDGTNEKDIALQLAKAIKENNTNDNIEIVLSRTEDVFNNVKEKAEFSNNEFADLFVSIHCSDAGKGFESKNGFEVFTVSKEKDNGFKNESDVLANYVLNDVSSNGIKCNGIRSRQVGIWVLQATKCPAILIEAGYMTNKEDLKMMKDVNKQKLMAVNILKGLEKYLIEIEEKGYGRITINESSGNLSFDELKEYEILLNKSLKNYKANNKTYQESLTEVEKKRLEELFKRTNKDSMKHNDSSGSYSHKAIAIRVANQKEIDEYNSYINLTLTNNTDISKKYDLSKLTEQQKERMFELFDKMSERQKSLAVLKVFEPGKQFLKNLPTESLFNKWILSNNYSFTINHKDVTKQFISETKNDYAAYMEMNTYADGDDPSKNKYTIELKTKDFVNRASKRKKLYWNNIEVDANYKIKQASLKEMTEVQVFAEKYEECLFSADTDCVKEKDKKRMMEIYEKMSDNQKASSPVQFPNASDFTIMNIKANKKFGIEKNSNQTNIPKRTGGFIGTSLEIPSGSGATTEELNEYQKFVDKGTSKETNVLKRYSSKNFTEVDKGRMYMLYCKMTFEQREKFPFNFYKPMKPSPISIPSQEELTKWANNKTYGVWIDDKKVNNETLKKYAPSDFSNFDVSKLYGAAIKTANGRTVQIDLMTNSYYKNYVERKKKEKYILWFKPDFDKIKKM